MSVPQDINVLDCTLRDGGYYNKWNFSHDLVASYLEAIDVAGIDAVEVGFRFPDKAQFLGPFAYSTDNFLEQLPLPSRAKIGVMVNAKDLLQHSDGPVVACHKLFRNKSDSPVDLVRIAAHFKEIDDTEDIAQTLKQLGYLIGFNMMQAGDRDARELEQAAASIAKWEAVDILYFADSLGNMSPLTVKRTIESLQAGWNGPLGIHAHDNMGRALANSLAALETGISWVDGTVLGMGRGAGNVCTEYLLLELAKRGMRDYFPQALFPLVIQEFEKLRRQYGWGPNLLYYLSGSYGIHPTYVQELLGNVKYETHHIIDALEALKSRQATSYTADSLHHAVLSHQGLSSGTWFADDWCQNKDLLVIAPGPGASEHREALCQFIDKTQPRVICLNANDGFPEEKVSAYAACHMARLLLDVDKLRSASKPLIMPYASLPDMLQAKLKDATIWDYGMEVNESLFEVSSTACKIPSSLVAAYVFAIGVASGAQRILLAGFDGYGKADPRQDEMNEVLLHYNRLPQAVPLLAVTPTTYEHIPQGSIYMPSLSC